LFAIADKNFLSNLKKSTLWIIFALAAVSIVAFSFLPAEMVFTNRIAFPFEVFIIVAITKLAGYAPRIAIVEIAAFLILLSLSFAHGKSAYRNSLYLSRQIAKRNLTIEASKARGDFSPVVPAIPWGDSGYPERLEYVSGYTFISDIGSDPYHWTNTCFARALGLTSVVVKKASGD
jgi:hypothetical protein